MEYEDRITIPTPEGVELDVLLAGYGSRFSAQLSDGAIKAVLIGALFLVLRLGGGFGAAAFVIAFFVIYIGYDIAFETLASGRTPGKRWSGMRVVREGGGAMTFTTSAIRNVLRIIDGVATGYAVGTISILVSRHNQRVGDIAAGTLVVRDAPAPARETAPAGPRTMSEGDSWDVTGVTPEELAAVRGFLERRYTLELAPRSRLASQLAEGLRAKVAGAPDSLPPETFLEVLAAAKARRS
jgi:uncharacterized RDD family membrane protein YckC